MWLTEIVVVDQKFEFYFFRLSGTCTDLFSPEDGDTEFLRCRDIGHTFAQTINKYMLRTIKNIFRESWHIIWYNW